MLLALLNFSCLVMNLILALPCFLAKQMMNKTGPPYKGVFCHVRGWKQLKLFFHDIINREYLIELFLYFSEDSVCKSRFWCYCKAERYLPRKTQTVETRRWTQEKEEEGKQAAGPSSKWFCWHTVWLWSCGWCWCTWATSQPDSLLDKLAWRDQWNDAVHAFHTVSPNFLQL